MAVWRSGGRATVGMGGSSGSLPQELFFILTGGDCQSEEPRKVAVSRGGGQKVRSRASWRSGTAGVGRRLGCGGAAGAFRRSASPF